MSKTVDRIVHNTFYLYTRMVVLMILSFYSSRLLLKSLGVDDYGVLSVVGSVTATFSSLRSVFAESIQRFLNYAKGKENINEEIEVFNIGVILHIGISILFLVLVELCGVYLLNTRLQIPLERMETANYVLQWSILATFFMILLIPYDAVIIANEKMNVYAWVSILDGFAKLAFVLILPVVPFDRLSLYAFLLILIPLINLIIYILYCTRFQECKYNFHFSKQRLKKITNFAGWSFAGNLFYTLTHEGLNILINIFAGVAANAARNISYQVRNAVNQISNNTILATKPYLIQHAATAEVDVIYKDMIKISRASFFIMSLTIFPVFTYADVLLKLWLGNAPEQSVLFSRFILIGVLIRSLHGPINLFFQASGKIRNFTILESVILLCLLPLCYVAFLVGLPTWIVFLLLAIAELIIVISLIILICRSYGMNINLYLLNVLLPSLVIITLGLLLYWGFDFYFIGSGLLNAIFRLIIFFLVILGFANAQERHLVGWLVKSLFK